MRTNPHLEIGLQNGNLVPKTTMPMPASIFLKEGDTWPTKSSNHASKTKNKNKMSDQ